MTLEAYQQQLEKFIAVVPTRQTPSLIMPSGLAHYGEVLSGTPVLPRPKTADLTDYAAQVAAANIVNNSDFAALTNYTHTQLLNAWKDGGHMTSCNVFAANATAAMGASGLGSFGVVEQLSKLNKMHCWILPESGARPNYGDLFECLSHTPGNSYMNIHVGISLKVEGDKWYTIEGGQGGAGTGVDKVARCVRKYDTSHILGWVDMKLFLTRGLVIPDWLIGSWVIYAGDQTFNYRINRYGEVKQLAFQASGALADTVPPLDTGRVSLAGSESLSIQWTREGGTERFNYDRMNSFPAIMEKMNGIAADGATLQGIRM